MAYNQAKLSNALNNLAAEMPKLQELSNFYLALSKFGLYPCPRNAFFDFVFPNVCEPEREALSANGFYTLQSNVELEPFYLFTKYRISSALQNESLNPQDYPLQIDHHVTFLTGSALLSLKELPQDAKIRSPSDQDLTKKESSSYHSYRPSSALLHDQRGLPSPCQTYFPSPSSRFEWNHPRFELSHDNYVRLALQANWLMIDTFRRFHNLVQIWTSLEFLTYENLDLSSAISNYAHFSRSIVPHRLETFPHECPLLERLESDSALLDYTPEGNRLPHDPNFFKLSNHLLDQVHTFELDLRNEEFLSKCSPLCKFHHFATGETRRIASKQPSLEILQPDNNPAKPHVCLCQSVLTPSSNRLTVRHNPSVPPFFPLDLVDETRLSHLSRETVSTLPHLRATFTHWNKLFREPDDLPTLIGYYLNRDVLALILLPVTYNYL
jgi:hypothetical protein